MNCRRVFFVENEEGWGAGVNGDRRRKLENAKFVSKSLNHGGGRGKRKVPISMSAIINSRSKAGRQKCRSVVDILPARTKGRNVGVEATRELRTS